MIPFVTEELWDAPARTEGLLATSRLPAARRRAASIPTPRREMGRAIEAIRALRGWRDSVGVQARRSRAGDAARRAATRRPPTRVARAGALRASTTATAASGGEPVATVAIPGGTVGVLASDAVDLGAAERRLRGAARDAAHARSRAPRASSPTRASSPRRRRRSSRPSARSSSACARSSRRCEPGAATRMTAPAPAPAGWSARDAERWLLSLELFGMRFGLDRMRRLDDGARRAAERFARSTSSGRTASPRPCG